MRINGPVSPQTPVRGGEGRTTGTSKGSAGGHPTAPRAEGLTSPADPESLPRPEEQALARVVTYRPDGRPMDGLPAPTGQRIDVRG